VPLPTVSPVMITKYLAGIVAVGALSTMAREFAHQYPQRIRPGEKVPLELHDRERALILEHTFV
jgi:hypothetical protein